MCSSSYAVTAAWFHVGCRRPQSQMETHARGRVEARAGAARISFCKRGGARRPRHGATRAAHARAARAAAHGRHADRRGVQSRSRGVPTEQGYLRVACVGAPRASDDENLNIYSSIMFSSFAYRPEQRPAPGPRQPSPSAQGAALQGHGRARRGGAAPGNAPGVPRRVAAARGGHARAYIIVH